MSYFRRECEWETERLLGLKEDPSLGCSHHHRKFAVAVEAERKVAMAVRVAPETNFAVRLPRVYPS